jgi:hypothetical protein
LVRRCQPPVQGARDDRSISFELALGQFGGVGHP